MEKKKYQKNPGLDDDWIVEGGVDPDCVQELRSKKKCRGLEFRSIESFPDATFRDLARLRFLRHLQFHDCSLTRGCLAGIKEIPKLETLWIENSDVGDDAVECLTSHPKLRQVVLIGTAITDQSLQYVATLPRLDWLWLNDTAITDKGLANLVAASVSIRLDCVKRPLRMKVSCSWHH